MTIEDDKIVVVTFPPLGPGKERGHFLYGPGNAKGRRITDEEFTALLKDGSTARPPTSDLDGNFGTFEAGNTWGHANALYWVGRGIGFDGLLDPESALDALRSGLERGQHEKRELTRRQAIARFEKNYDEEHKEHP